MATLPKSFEYKIEKNVPLVRSHNFDETQPEYITMLKLKPGESFEFPASRARNIQNCRLRIVRDKPDMAFTATGEAAIKNKNLKVGRCWRLPDGSARKYNRTKK